MLPQAYFTLMLYFILVHVCVRVRTCACRGIEKMSHSHVFWHVWHELVHRVEGRNQVSKSFSWFLGFLVVPRKRPKNETEELFMKKSQQKEPSWIETGHTCWLGCVVCAVKFSSGDQTQDPTRFNILVDANLTEIFFIIILHLPVPACIVDPLIFFCSK